jgi:N4-(beta-N-acetylglucosaminyl)-L-asparaginase
MGNRRSFVRAAVAAPALLAAMPHRAVAAEAERPAAVRIGVPCVVSTWDFGIAANRAAWAILDDGGRALDAVEAGARVPEADLRNHSVGRAGYPDRDGRVTLDASIMDENGRCGAVAAMEHIAHPISVARRVMERTPHVLLVGDGATQFAIEQGFARENLLTPESEAAWRAWLKTSRYEPVPNGENATYGTSGLGIPGGKNNHDTLWILALDTKGNIAGACTTSGMAWKMHGRVGDSPLIGAGLYVDNEVGGATSTGVGEEVIRTCGSFLVVELMRQGRSPQAACEEAVARIVTRNPDAKELQVGFLAIDKHGEVGAWAIRSGFRYAACDGRRQDRSIASGSTF